MKKFFFTAAAAYAAVILSAAFVQKYFLPAVGKKIFPDYVEILPHQVNELRYRYEHRNDRPTQVVKKNYFHSGENHARLAKFFTRLQALEEKKADHVHIMHWGDSLIWGDNMSSVMKKNFQRDFGDGGRGIVSALEISSTRLCDHVNKTSPQAFQVNTLIHFFNQNGVFYCFPPARQDLGFTGESCRPLSPLSEIRLATPDGFTPWRKVELFLRAPNGTAPTTYLCQVKLVTPASGYEKAAVIKSGECAVLPFDNVNAGSVAISFSGTQGALPFVDGINLETPRGVVYSTLVRMGTHMSWLAAVPEENFAPNMKYVAPDLVIFQYGINEAASLDSYSKLTAPMMKEQMTDWIRRLKKHAPDANILLIGPPERLRKVAGANVPMKETLDVIRLQRELCEENGLAFFDTYEFLGGEGQMAGLVQRGLALDDYMHISVRGGNLLATAVYDTVINAYKEHVGRTAEIRQIQDIRTRAERNRPIVFNSKGFGYFFLLVLIVSILLRKKERWRMIFTAAASFYFYSTLALMPLLLVLGMSASDYILGNRIRSAKLGGRSGRAYLVASLVVDLGVLFVFKYAAFTANSINSIAGLLGLHPGVPVYNLMLPAGISFFTFKSLTYTIDLYHGNGAPAKSFIDYLTFVSFFPQLLAGPISRASHFFKNSRVTGRVFSAMNGSLAFAYQKTFSTAMFLILCGLMKKAGADWLGANIVDRVYSNPGMFSSVEVLTAVIAYGVQIYGDFSGYSDIAIGCASILGFKLPDNFNRPYLSFSITDFWRRWHMTLGAWFRDYLYISLGGNRKRVYLNLMITMLLCGLWHNAAVNFIIWGGYHGLFLVFERAAGMADKPRGRFTSGIRIALTTIIVLFGWIIFRASSWQNFIDILRTMGALKFSAANLSAAILAVTALFYLVHFTPLSWKTSLRSFFMRMPSWAIGASAAVVTIFLYNVSIADIQPFIYFQF